MRISKRLRRILRRGPGVAPRTGIGRSGLSWFGMESVEPLSDVVECPDDILDAPETSPPPASCAVAPIGPALPPGIGGLVAYVSPSIMVVVGY